MYLLDFAAPMFDNGVSVWSLPAGTLVAAGIIWLVVVRWASTIEPTVRSFRATDRRVTLAERLGQGLILAGGALLVLALLVAMRA